MKHATYRQWLLLIGELDSRQRQELDAHLAECDDCRNELRQINALGAMMEQAKPADVSPQLLREARLQLRAALRAQPESLLSAIWRRLTGAVRPPLRVALGGGLVFAAGLGAGVFLSKGTPAPAPIPPESSGAVRIENVRLVESDPVRNEVTCAFDLVRPATLRGSVSDTGIQRVLLHALLNEENPGTRLRTASTLSGLDPEVKRAMIRVLANDENPGVRQEALKALQRFPFDAEVKGALLGVLKNEKNAALRIAAINALDSAKVHRGFADDVLLDALRRSMEQDDNHYVRVRSKSVLEEIKEQ